MLWEGGDAEPSMELLHQAISRLVQRLEQSQKEQGPSGSASVAPPLSTNESFSNFALSSLKLGEVLGPAETGPFATLKNEFYFFRSVFLIEDDKNPTCKSNSPSSTSSHIFLAVVMSYNLAVLLHATAMLQGSVPLLGQALGWYQGTLPLLLLASDGQDSTGPNAVALQRALWTYMGHVANLLEDGVTMEVCCRELTRIQQQQEQKKHQQDQDPAPSLMCIASSNDESDTPVHDSQVVISPPQHATTLYRPWEHFAAAA